MGNVLAILFIITMFGCCVMFGVNIGKQTAFDHMINKCQKENNVYMCKVIAVPIDMKGQKHE